VRGKVFFEDRRRIRKEKFVEERSLKALKNEEKGEEAVEEREGETEGAEGGCLTSILHRCVS